MKTTHPITYHYSFDHDGVTHDIALTRRHTGTAYARNGNVGNPTEYFRWDATVDGVQVNGGLGFRDRSDAYENARAFVLGIRYANDDNRRRWVNVRSWVLVRDEMKSNYRSREVAPS